MKELDHFSSCVEVASSKSSHITLSIKGVLYRTTQQSVSHLKRRVPLKKPAEAALHATHPPEERGTHGVSAVNPDDAARWLALADVALIRGASAVDVAETEA